MTFRSLSLPFFLLPRSRAQCLRSLDVCGCNCITSADGLIALGSRLEHLNAANNRAIGLALTDALPALRRLCRLIVASPVFALPALRRAVAEHNAAASAAGNPLLHVTRDFG